MMGRLTELTKRFKSAAESHRWIKDRIANGDQFNCYERQSNDDDMADDEREYRLGIGPISNFAYMFDIEGQDMAEIEWAIHDNQVNPPKLRSEDYD